MKLNKKEVVYELIESYSIELKHDEYPKFTTNFLSEKLDMQRTNLSSILNQLVNEGKLIKHNGRPVLYQYVDLIGDGNDIFSRLIGYDRSLKEAVSVAKAAVLYPEGKTSILLTAARGCGVSYFAQTVFQFAVKSGSVRAKSELLTFDCKAYKENEEFRKNVLYGTNDNEGLLEKSRNGMLLIKSIELLPGYERKQILKSQDRGILICCVSSDIKEDTLESLKEYTDFQIHMPAIKERTLEERFDIIKKFFQEEAGNLKRNLEVDSSILFALLLYEVIENTKGLKNDIHAGCAACYARAHQSKKTFIQVLMSDFPNYVRKGIIYYKVHKEEIDELLSDEFVYAFTDSNMLKKQKSKRDEKGKSIYQSLDKRKKQLRVQNIREEEINTLISGRLQHDFEVYVKDLCDKMKSRDQLKLLVSEKLIRLVESFLLKAQQSLGIEFKEKLVGAICFHMNGCLVRVDSKQRISNEEINEMIQVHPVEYELAKEFIGNVEREFMISMNIDEVIYMILFLIQNKKKVEQKVVTLIAMHGSNAASSIAAVANTMVKEGMAIGFDLPLDKHIQDAYEELKQTMIRIHQGKGILLIYDMGSIRTMAESIAEETGIHIKYLEVPITLLAIAGSERASNDDSLEDIFQYLQNNFNNIEYIRQTKSNHTSLKELLKQEADPESTANNTIVVEEPQDSITGTLPGHRMAGENAESAIADTYEYLSEQFGYLNMNIMEELLTSCIKQLEELLNIKMDEDQKIGLIIHIVFLVHRMQGNYIPAINFIASDIIMKNQELVLQVKEILRPVEKEYGVYINDGEIATIISIIR